MFKSTNNWLKELYKIGKWETWVNHSKPVQSQITFLQLHLLAHQIKLISVHEE